MTLKKIHTAFVYSDSRSLRNDCDSRGDRELTADLIKHMAVSGLEREERDRISDANKAYV